MKQRNSLAMLALGAALLVGACGKSPEPATPAPQPEPAARGIDEDAARREAEERAAREAAEREAAAREAAERERLRAMIAERIFFDYDRYDIRADARTTLDGKVEALRRNPSIRLTIEGHADERGSVEYNLALGMRRAEAARDYLSSFGIDASRLTVATFGEQMPLESGQSESAWARNRRAEFRIEGGSVSTRN